MDCRYCEIQVEITKRAYAARCPHPVDVLDYIREKMKSSTRPRVELADMKRVSPPPVSEESMAIADRKHTEAPQDDRDLLTTAAKAIGTTLGKIAVKTGIAKPPAPTAKVRKKAAAKKKPAAKRSPGKSSRPTKTTKKAQPKKKSK